ncbi:sarcosine oxidase subunit gamma [Ensifer soli]|uniref:sarcosine oxidase subunit gamma n=1 Tax=Ciceribacter sp. sgz301302 TaxID=3342379 RepID=UPI0035BA00B2
MADAIATRKPTLSGFLGGSAAARLTPAPPSTRLSLRAKPDAVAALSSAFGLDLPTRPKTSASANGRHALWLGPDEWLLIDETEADLLAVAASAGVLHSATDVSHRNMAVLVEGPRVEATLQGACPLDLSLNVFPVGGAARTVYGKAEIVLYRTREDAFRVECWRSFAPYVAAMLAEGAADAAL